MIMILVMIKKTWNCKVSPRIQERFQWYDGEIRKLEARIMELEARTNDQREVDLQDEEAFVEEYNEAGFVTEEDNEDYLGEEFDEFYGEYFPKDKIVKRDVGQFIGGLAQSVHKGLEGNIIGGVSKFFSTILQPAFEYLIDTNDDHTMTRFTNRALPHDTLTGPESVIVRNAVKQGSGETVWSTVSGVAKTWNPRSIYKDDDHKDPAYLQCRKMVPLVDKAMVRRLQDVSLAATSLITSLHDTQKMNIEKGFAETTRTLDWIVNTTRKLVVDHNLLQELLDVVKDESMEMTVIIITGVIIVLLLLSNGMSLRKQRRAEIKMEEMKEEIHGLKEVVLILKDRDEAATRSRETTQNILRNLEAAMLGIAARNAVDEEVDRRMMSERGAVAGLPLQGLPLPGYQAGAEPLQGMQVSVQNERSVRRSINKPTRQFM